MGDLLRPTQYLIREIYRLYYGMNNQKGDDTMTIIGIVLVVAGLICIVLDKKNN